MTNRAKVYICNINKNDNKLPLNINNTIRKPSRITYNYSNIRKRNLPKILCVREYTSNPKFIAEFLQSHCTEDLDMYDEWFLNRYVV